MKWLIINADDLGSDAQRNKGIFKAIEAGIVKSVSILPNGPATKDAIRLIKSMEDKKISIGIHINLSEGMPITKDLKSIVGVNGCFLSKPNALRLLSTCHDIKLKKEIGQEMDAQIKSIIEAGVYIDHMDGHHHIHIMPAVIDIAIKKAKEYCIGWMRTPYEPFNMINTLELDEMDIQEASFFSRYAETAKVLIKDSGINTTDHFIGLYMKGRLSPEILREVSKMLKDGITEMMVHPGYKTESDTPNPFTGFSTNKREDELNALIHPDFRASLKTHHVNLKSFIEVHS